MTAIELKTVFEFEGTLQVGQAVLVKWTAGSFGHFSAPAKVLRVNRASVRVEITKDIPHYAARHQIVVPLLKDSGMKTWTYFNRVEPANGYQAV